MAYAKDVLVSTDWLEEHLGDPGVRIVEVDENPHLYADAHVPGAVGLDWKRELQDPVRRDFLGPEAFGELLGSRGIGSDHTIALYGDRNNWFAAYTYWYLKFYGHEDVRLVDVRSPQEYSGELIAMPGFEQEGAQRGGHIPGARSVPWAEALEPDGTFKSRDELERLYTEQGVVGDGPVIVYCRIGERAAHTWFVLHELLGKDDVRAYDGSWTEWGNLVDVPIERDP